MNSQYPIDVVLQSYAKDSAQFMMPSYECRQWIMFAVESGKFFYQIQDVAGEAASGEIVLCPPSIVCHRQVIEPLTFHYIALSIRDSESDKFAKMNQVLHRVFSYKFTSNERDRLLNDFRHLRSMLMLEDPDSIWKRQHIVNDIWMLLHMETDNYLKFSKMIEDPPMKQAKDIMEQNAFRDFRLLDVAEFLDIHPVQFTRRFQRTFNVTPSQYLLSIRMEKAKSLLIQTDLTLDQIADMCGYDNGFYLSRIFTKYTKMPPSLYRKLNKMSIP